MRSGTQKDFVNLFTKKSRNKLPKTKNLTMPKYKPNLNKAYVSMSRGEKRALRRLVDKEGEAEVIKRIKIVAKRVGREIIEPTENANIE